MECHAPALPEHSLIWPLDLTVPCAHHAGGQAETICQTATLAMTIEHVLHASELASILTMDANATLEIGWLLSISQEPRLLQQRLPSVTISKFTIVFHAQPTALRAINWLEDASHVKTPSFLTQWKEFVIVAMMVKPHQQQLLMECVLNGKTALNFPTTITPPPFSSMMVPTIVSNVQNMHANATILPVLLDQQTQTMETITAWVRESVKECFGTQ